MSTFARDGDAVDAGSPVPSYDRSSPPFVERSAESGTASADFLPFPGTVGSVATAGRKWSSSSDASASFATEA